MAEAPLRVALIGYGAAGRIFHAPLIRHAPGLELALVASRRRDELAHALPGVEVVSLAEEALLRPDIDLVAIASPNATHAPLAEHTAELGHNVVARPVRGLIDQ